MKNCNEFYGQHCGSEHIFKYGFGGIKVTIGVLAVARETQSFWFLDIVSSYQSRSTFKNHAMQVWTLKRIEGDRFSVTCTDGDGDTIVTQNVPYSDFEYDQYKVWLIDSTIMLPSEY